MSDSPFPPDKSEDVSGDAPKYGRGQNPRSRCNLIAPAKPGEVRNPKGHNGQTKSEILAMVMEEPSESDPERRKIEMVVRAQYRRALRGSDQAAKTLIEHYKGLPSRPMNKLEIANHLLGVAKLQTDLALGILGNRINAMDPDKLRQFFAECSDNPCKFLEKAQELLAAERGENPAPALPSSAESEKT